ncbi:mucin-17 [Pseudorasbora parva]|uniref:mucin-17 n=1 Tax=Pseudorasbora parva TaxID=51549 RepID=UPI00351DD353
MERWVLEGDSYSFLRSAPQTFNLQNREGPNRVEIFDITSIPNHRNAISETTCLCDIFGDDVESPSLSSSPASVTFVRRVDQPFPADDANDSSGSYHTANGSDLSDNIEVTYNTPSPKNIPDFFTSETRKSESHPDKSNILSDSKNGLNPLECTPPATKGNVNDLSHTGYTWEEPQVSASTAPVNETKITNASEPQDMDSTPAINQINPGKDISNPTSYPSEEKEPDTFEQEEIITAPQHTNTSPFLDKQDCIPIFESNNYESLAESPLEQNNVVSSENKESMNYHSPQEENVLLAQRIINSGSVSKLPIASPTDCSPVQEMSTSPAKRDINILPIPSVMPEPILTSISPVSREIISTPAATGRSSPELLNLSSTQVGNTSEFPDLADTYGASSSVSFPTSDYVEIDPLSLSAISTETRGPVCSCIDDRESLESPEINETSFSPDHSAPAYSPEPVIIHSPMGYTISPSPTNERIISSTEPEALPSSPLSTRIDCTDICSSHSSMGYTISPSPTNERLISSTEPEALSSSPVSKRIDYRDICSSPDQSEPVTILSSLGSTISPSPTNERIISSTEPEALLSSPVSTRIDYRDICSSHSPMGYTISPSPTNMREVSSTEPEALSSPPVSTRIDYRDICSSHSPMGYSISPSPTNMREVSSTEPEALSSSPVSTRIDYRDICSSHSPMGYTISPSPTNMREVSSTEPEALSSSPVSKIIDHRDICSSPDQSEPVTFHSSLGYTISPSPTNERGVYLPETEASTSSPCCPSDIYNSSDHSIPPHSSEPAINHSPMGYTISQSPTNKRMVCSTEPDEPPSSPAITGNGYRATTACSRDSTPTSRSIASTPNSREHYLTPEPISTAPLIELRSVTCSPEIKTISYSVLPHNTKSPVTGGISSNVSPNEDLAQSPVVSPTSRNILSTPENRSRPSSTASNRTRDTAQSIDLLPSIPLEKPENQSLPILFKGVNLPSPIPIDSDHFDNLADPETFKSSGSVPDECTGSGPQILSQMQILQDSRSKPLGSGSSTVNMKQNQEIITDDTTALTVCGTSASRSPFASSMPMPGTSVEKKKCHIEDYDSNKETEMLENVCPSSDKRHSKVPIALQESPSVICRHNGGKFDRQPCREKEESKKREGVGEETMRDSSYRGQQVELSFSARNRKGPAGHSPALSSRDPKSGIPARCYFESYPTTLQQQSQLRAQGSQQENKGGARRLQSTTQGKYSSASFLPPECTGENSSMGSEFDEADNEVKWFTDLAFRSLSSPQVDYLDVYNSSHRSSTNVSQPSTVDSPGAVAWMTYADLRGSGLHENDGSSFLPCDKLDPNKHFEMGSFECVDVALEIKEESNRGKRTVPKRQIQLLRRNPDEPKHKGNSENVLNSPSTSRHSQDILVRQHSTPAFVQEEVFKEVPDSLQKERKRTLQKSVSLDDGSPKTQMASCIIKSVLSKKMQDVQKEKPKSADPSPSGEENKHPDFSPCSFDGVLSNMEQHSLSSSQQSECTFLSKDFAVGEERVSHRQLKKCAPKVPPKPFLRPGFFNTGEAQGAGYITREETKPIAALTSVDDKILLKQNSKSDGKEGGGGNLGETYNGDSANASVRNTSPAVATPAVSMQSKITSRDTKRQMTPENQEKRSGKSVFMSKTPEMTLKPSSIKGKKMTSLKVSLSPDIEHSREMSESQSMENAAEDMNTKSSQKVIETEEDDDNSKKSVRHKVRDVRKLVKNTYNLSFKASNSTSNEDPVIQEKKEQLPQTPPALHIECKAISWKDKQTSASKTIHCHVEKQPVDISKISQPLVGVETRRDADITEITSKASSPKTESLQNVPDSHSTIIDGSPKSDSITRRSYVHCDQSTKMPPRPPSKEREISALVVLPDGTSKSKTFDSTTTDSTQTEATSNSHSVSMLLKEKGMQADIGVCDVVTEGASATARHVNRLEIPVQACLSEVFSNEAQVRVENTTSTCSPTTLVKNSSRTSQQSESPKGTLTEESTNEQERKKLTAITTMTQNPTYLATSDKQEIRSFSNSTKNNGTPVNASKEIELPIQVRSISTDRLKPFVPQKPSYKQSFAEIRSVSSDPPKTDAQVSPVIKHQTRLSSESKKNETTTVVHKDQPNEASSRDAKRLAVSAVSSYKPPHIPVTTTQSTVQKSTTMTLASLDQQQSSALCQTTSTCQQQTPSFSQENSVLGSSVASNSSGAQALDHIQSVTRASSNNRFHTDDYLFYASDDPPSYDERESFSPLRLLDLPPQRSCRYHPTTKQSPCSCVLSSHSHQGHPQNSPQERVPSASRSPGQVLTCPGAPPQAQVRPQQCRPDALPVSNATIPHSSALIQPLLNPRACPVSNSQSYGDDQPPTSGLHSERRPANHPSPQATAPAPYHDYSHSANMSTLDPRPQLFNPQDLPSSFGHDYTNEGPGGAGVLYPENASGLNCGQGPRRVLLDPETGKYFYIEVPMQPLRKMLFDPELGQYVEVLIPQQAMSHSGLYPPAAPPYSSLHSPGLYAPQYLPYAMPSYPAIPGSAQQVRHPEPPPVPTTLNQASLRYGSPASQMPKNEPKGHSSLDQSYLESMYYIPTGMNASPNSTPSDCYHKAPSSMPPSGGRRA